jgi:uncharacterized protein YkwD
MTSFKKFLPPIIILTFLFTGCSTVNPVKDPNTAPEYVQAPDNAQGKAIDEKEIDQQYRHIQEEMAERIRKEELRQEQLKKEAEEKAKAEDEERGKKEQNDAAAKAKEQAQQQTKVQQPKVETVNASASDSSGSRPDIPENYPVEYWQEVENQIVALCNEEREKASLKPLQINEELKKIARYKSNEMLQHQYFSHSSPITSFMPWDLAKNFGYKYTAFGENLWMSRMSSEDPKWTDQFKAVVTAKEIVADWMNSPGHKNNILNKSFSKIGVGVAYSSKLKAYAVQEFSN